MGHERTAFAFAFDYINYQICPERSGIISHLDGAIPANDGKFQNDYSIFSNQYKNKVIRFGKLLV